MELDSPPGVVLGHLGTLKNRASFLLKDGLKIARVALVDVSTAEMMTEDATNMDEWGPTPKTMADICSVVYNSEDYLRVVQVLHRRFALNAKKHWRQIHKSLQLLEYLLCRGPEDLVVEFREDKKQFEQLARFVDVDSTGCKIDWSSVLQKRAKHVLRLLTDEAFYKEERRKAQKILNGISGFGSESLSLRSPKVAVDSDAMDQDYDEDSSSLLVDNEEERDQPSIDTKRNFKSSDADISSPVSQNELLWDAFSISSPHDNGCASGRSTYSATSETNLYEESPTSVLSVRKSAQALDLKKNKGGESFPKCPPAGDFSPSTNPPPLHKLPPPPPVAEYKYVTPQASLKRGSRVQGKQPGSLKSPHVIPDLIII